MVIPAWVITGFLDSGKTTLMNRLIQEVLEDQDILAIQFEKGDIPLIENEQVRKLHYSKEELETEPFEIAASICDCLKEHPVDLVMIEWNGMEHFHKLEEMLLQFSVKSVLSIEKVIYTADEEKLRGRIADAGAISMSQIGASDCAWLRTESPGPARERQGRFWALTRIFRFLPAGSGNVFRKSFSAMI
ncbi:MAG: GTP-binding protein [Lacrimispora sp.]